jgi:hypothetical protein
VAGPSGGEKTFFDHRPSCPIAAMAGGSRVLLVGDEERQEAVVPARRKKLFSVAGSSRPDLEILTHISDIDQVKNEKKSFIFRCMLRQMTLENAGEGQPWHQSM